MRNFWILSLVIISSFGVFSVTLAAVEISDGSVIALWHFDENSIDASGNAHNGTDTSVSYDVGKFNDAAVFNGSTSKISVTDSSSLKPTGDFSVTMWVKTSDSSDQGLFQSYNNVSSVIGGFRTAILASPTGDTRFVSGKNTGASLGTDFQQIDSTYAVNDNEWNFLAFIFDGSDLKICTNGNTCETQSWLDNAAYNATNYVQIGMRRQNATDALPLNGSLDEIVFFNTAISETIINDLYNSGTGNTVCTTEGCGSDPEPTPSAGGPSQIVIHKPDIYGGVIMILVLGLGSLFLYARKIESQL